MSKRRRSDVDREFTAYLVEKFIKTDMLEYLEFASAAGSIKLAKRDAKARRIGFDTTVAVGEEIDDPEKEDDDDDDQD